MKHSNWYVTRKQQSHQQSINVVKVDPSKNDIHAVINCRACYGRGYTGKNLTTGEIVPCKCLKLKAKIEHHEVTPTTAIDERPIT
jgi:hypothetical protein